MLKTFGVCSYGKQYINISNWGEENSNLYIGNYCSIAGNFNVMLGGNHHYDFITTSPLSKLGDANGLFFPELENKPASYSNGDINIGNDVWIGNNVTIMSGIKIGNGVVIAMNSTIVKDVPDYAIVGGNPAKIIKYRFSEEQIVKLLEIKWWEWSIEKVRENAKLLTSNDIQLFIDKHI